MASKKLHIYYGWFIVAALFFIWAIPHGLVISGFTAYIEPLTNTFGWSITEVTFAASLRSLIYVIFMPIAGMIVDRYSARKVVFTGIFLTSIGIISLSWINTIFQFYLCFILIGVGTSASTATIPLTLVGRWFQKKLSFATAILMSGTGIGALLVPLATRIIDGLGWHSSMVIIGISVFVIISPLTLLIRQNPQQYGFLPDGDINDEPVTIKEKSPAQNNNVDNGIKQSLKSRIFWHISIAFMFHALAVHSFTTNLMPYLSTIGSTRMVSSFVVSALAILSIVGRLSYGWLGDKFNRKWVAASGTFLVGLSLIIFSYITSASTWVLIPAIILFGIGWGGSITLHSVILKECFGVSNLGGIIGFSLSISAIGMMVGPPLASWIFENSGDYRIAWFMLIGLVIIGIISQITNPAIRIKR